MSRILIGPAIGEAFGLIFADVARFFALGGSWLLAVAALLMLTTLSLIGWPNLVILPALAAMACFLAGAASFTVMALRVVMRRPVTPPGLTLRFGARERRFARHAVLVILLLAAALFGFLVALPALARSLFAAAPLAVAMPVLAFLLLLCFAAAAAASRLALAFPALALDERAPPFAPAWHRGEGNGGRIFVGLLGCALPFLMLQRLAIGLLGTPIWFSALAYAGGGDIPDLAPGQVVAAIIGAGLAYLQLAVSVAFIAVCHQDLADNAMARTSAPFVAADALKLLPVTWARRGGGR
jgi:hypothetical protein